MGGSSSVRGDQTIYHTDNLCFDGTDRGSPMDTNGQLWIGATASDRADNGGHVRLGELTSPDASVTIGYSAPDITLMAGAAIPLQFTEDSGVAIPAANNLNVLGTTAAAGTSPLVTSGAGSTVTITAQRSVAIAAGDSTRVGLSNFDSAAFDVDANGFVQLNGGGIAATSFDVQANTGPGTDPVVPTAAGVVTVNGAAVANHSVVLETRSRAANAYNLEVQYATTAAATDATKSGVAHFDSTDFSVDANGFVALAGAGAGQTITGDAGGALPPTAGNWNILGRSGSKTSGTGSTLTVNSPPYADQGGSTTVTLNSGSFATAAITLTTPATAGLLDGDLLEFVATNGVLVIQLAATQVGHLGSSATSAAGTFTSTATGDSLSLRYQASTNDFWATSSIGVWVLA